MAAQKAHVVGTSIGAGLQELELKNIDSTLTSDSIGYEVYYRYFFHDKFGVEAAYISGGNFWIGDFSKASNIKYNNFRIALYGEYTLSNINHLYAKLGVSANKLNYKLKDENGNVKHVSDSGADLSATLGWELRIESGFGINIEYNFLPVQKLTAQNLNIGISYRF
ncbi:porin family protein [Shewanella sp. MMG014]|nr:porin family protein [Shewanella sp. MMG014]